jgi:hypothetical protein
MFRLSRKLKKKVKCRIPIKCKLSSKNLRYLYYNPNMKLSISTWDKIQKSCTKGTMVGNNLCFPYFTQLKPNVYLHEVGGYFLNNGILI